MERNDAGHEQVDIFFNFDRICALGGKVWLNPGFPQGIVSETATTLIVMNSCGLLSECPNDGHGASIPHYIKVSIVTPDDWKRCKAERMRRDDPVRKVDITKLKLEHPPTRDYPLGVNCGSMIGRIRSMLTFEGLAYAVYDYPEIFEDMVETSCALVEDYLDQVLGKIDFDYASGWEDICFKNVPIVSVDFFKNVVMPRYKRISRKLHKAGIDLWHYLDLKEKMFGLR